MEDGLAIVLSAVKTKNSSTSGHLYITKHERQGNKQRKRERNRGRGGKQGCRGDQRGGREHTRRTGRRWTNRGAAKLRCGLRLHGSCGGQAEMQGWLRGRGGRLAGGRTEEQPSGARGLPAAFSLPPSGARGPPPPSLFLSPRPHSRSR